MLITQHEFIHWPFDIADIQKQNKQTSSFSGEMKDLWDAVTGCWWAGQTTVKLPLWSVSSACWAFFGWSYLQTKTKGAVNYGWSPGAWLMVAGLLCMPWIVMRAGILTCCESNWEQAGVPCCFLVRLLQAMYQGPVVTLGLAFVRLCFQLLQLHAPSQSVKSFSDGSTSVPCPEWDRSASTVSGLHSFWYIF